jgi:hypothetical protein
LFSPHSFETAVTPTEAGACHSASNCHNAMHPLAGRRHRFFLPEIASNSQSCIACISLPIP